MTWQQVEQKLADSLAPDVYALWIRPLKCRRFSNDLLELCGPDRFFCSWVANNLMTDIKAAMTGLAGQEVKIIFTTDASVSCPSIARKPSSGQQKQLCLPSVAKTPTFVRVLNPRYVFDEFVVGDCNAVAHSACQSLAHGGSEYGHCLYISAPTGRGKSHLTHAVAHYILAHNPRVRLNYLSAQQLTAEMVRSIRAKKMEDFKRKFQNSDILMLEDLQSLTGRAKTQEELSVILDILLESGKTVIFTGGQSPMGISGLESGVRSRMSSGLVTAISEPDLETKARIVTKKARQLKLNLSDELTWHLAEQIKGDMRQIKSALVGLKAKSSIGRQAADMKMLRGVLANIIKQAKTITPADIRDYIASQFSVNPEELLSKSRKRSIAFPRQISMYFARKYTRSALAEIGMAFNRDHSTVVHSIRVISEAINNDRSVQGQIKMLDGKLYEKFLS